MGTVNPDEVLPEYVAAMKRAGLDQIIEEAQKQIDTWMANR